MSTSLCRSRIWIAALIVIALSVWTNVAYGRLALGHGAVHPVDSMLLTDNREELRICVESLVASESTPMAREFVSEVLPTVRAHRHFEPAGYAVGTPVVEIGCPGSPNLDSPHWNSKLGAPTIVSVPSTYRLFVYVMNPQELAALFKTQGPRTTAQEIVCEGDECAQVTTAVFVTPEELRDMKTLVTSLNHGLGLEWPSASESGSPVPGEK